MDKLKAIPVELRVSRDFCEQIIIEMHGAIEKEVMEYCEPPLSCPECYFKREQMNKILKKYLTKYRKLSKNSG